MPLDYRGQKAFLQMVMSVGSLGEEQALKAFDAALAINNEGSLFVLASSLPFWPSLPILISSFFSLCPHGTVL